MALKSSREGLRKELVDYLGNIIIDENLKQNIINSVDDVFINNEELTTSINELDEKIRNETSAREGADTTLQGNINAEAIARQEAITNVENLINSGVLKLDLLWTNVSPTSRFAQQTISLDLTNYELIIIETRWYTADINDNALISLNIIRKNEDFNIIMSRDVNAYRKVNFNNTSITFYNTAYYATYGTAITTINEEVLIPLKIYGMK